MFVHLRVHSEYSLLAGLPTISDLVATAKNMGMPALALTDRNRMSGLILFYQECLKQQIRPILGAELTCPQNPEQGLVVLARNEEGYADLCEIITERQLHPGAFSFSCPDTKAGVFDCPFPNLVLLCNHPDLLEILVKTPNKSNLYAELINTSKATRLQSRKVVDLARIYGLPMVVSNDVFFLEPKHFAIHQVLRAIDLCSSISRLRPNEHASAQSYFKTESQMQSLFPDHCEALHNTMHIADLCKIHLNLNKWIMPHVSVPTNETPDSYLSNLAYAGLERNYGPPHPPMEHIHSLKINTLALARASGRKNTSPNIPSQLFLKANQLQESDLYQKAHALQTSELAVIQKLGYASYFLMVRELREWANKTFSKGYRSRRDCTIMRGSAANSITFYNLGASDLDPIRYDLYFQRFLNEDRASPPDVDLDFSWDEREQVLEYFTEHFGRERVAITCTTNHFHFPSAFREVAKVYGYSDQDISHILDHHYFAERFKKDEVIQEIAYFAAQIKGKPHFLGQHPGGILVTNDPICRHVALEYSGGEKNRIITQIDMHNGIDELGLIKFDFLGNGSLGVLRDTLHQLENQNIPNPHVSDLEKCYADPLVQNIISTGKSRGVFYIESPAQMRLNQKVGARSFEDVTVTSSLVRPAAAKYTAQYVERRRKMESGIVDWEFVHPSLEPILHSTHDVIVFQEDITRVCHHVAGLSYKEADKIRKMMNSMREGELEPLELKNLETNFKKGCIDCSGLTVAQTNELWDRVRSFTDFSFCKSHSASYAQLSFKCAYLKAYYPAQFISAVLSNNHGFYTSDIYIDEARHLGIHILPICINTSQIKYYGSEKWIRPGLMHIKGLSHKSLDLLIKDRDTYGPYRDLLHFYERVAMGKADIEKLILVGAMYSFNIPQPALLFQLHGFKERKNSTMLDLWSQQTATPSIYAHSNQDVYNSKSTATQSTQIVKHKDYSYAEKCLNELSLMGYMISGNILELLALHPAARQAIPANTIHEYKDKYVYVFGKSVTTRLVSVVQSGKIMQFLTLADKSGMIDIIFWPNIYEKYQNQLYTAGPFLIYGKVIEDWGTFSIEAKTVRQVAWAPNQLDFNLASKILEKSVMDSTPNAASSTTKAA